MFSPRLQLRGIGQFQGTNVIAFQDIPAPPRNNGEVFLFQYREQQRQRNHGLNDVRDQKTKRCNCAQCIHLIYPLIGALPMVKCDCGYQPQAEETEHERLTEEFPRTKNHIIPAHQQSNIETSNKTRIDVHRVECAKVRRNS